MHLALIDQLLQQVLYGIYVLLQNPSRRFGISKTANSSVSPLSILPSRQIPAYSRKQCLCRSMQNRLASHLRDQRLKRWPGLEVQGECHKSEASRGDVLPAPMSRAHTSEIQQNNRHLKAWSECSPSVRAWKRSSSGVFLTALTSR